MRPLAPADTAEWVGRVTLEFSGIRGLRRTPSAFGLALGELQALHLAAVSCFSDGVRDLRNANQLIHQLHLVAHAHTWKMRDSEAAFVAAGAQAVLDRTTYVAPLDRRSDTRLRADSDRLLDPALWTRLIVVERMSYASPFELVVAASLATTSLLTAFAATVGALRLLSKQVGGLEIDSAEHHVALARLDADRAEHEARKRAALEGFAVAHLPERPAKGLKLKSIEVGPT